MIDATSRKSDYNTNATSNLTEYQIDIYRDRNTKLIYEEETDCK